MGEITNIFDFVNDEIEEKEKQVEEYQIQAYQIIRLRKQTIGVCKRDILDTIYVEHGNPELAERKANYKAERLGNCIVVALAEKIISSFFKSEEPKEEDDE